MSTFADNVTHNLCCQIRADDNSSTCTFMTGKSVTCTDTCANEIIPNRKIARLFTKQKNNFMLELHITIGFLHIPDLNIIGGVMVNMLAWSVVDRGFSPDR